MPVEILERTMSHLGNGIMLSWAMDALPTEELYPSAALGYALVLSAAATSEGRKHLDKHIAANRKLLSKGK